MIARLLPPHARQRIRLMLERAGIRAGVDRFVNLVFASALALGLIVALFANLLLGWPIIWVAGAVFIVVHLVALSMLILRGDAKQQFIEGVFPDALDLMAANMRAGLATDRAFILASRPEFGPLQTELDRAGREIALGKNVIDALQGLSTRIGSERVDKTLGLITSGIRSGGKLSELLSQASGTLKRQGVVEQKVKTTVAAYMIFIVAAVCIGAPFLFATSAFLVETLTDILGTVEIGDVPGGFLQFGSVAAGIPPRTVTFFAVLMLTTIGFMASLIIGQVLNGRARSGLKHVPLILLADIGLFFLFKFLIGSMLGAVFG